MSYRMNLDLSPQKFTKGGIELFLNWANRADGHGTEQAWVFRRAHGDTKRFAITRFSEAPRILKVNGYVEPEGIRIAGRIAECLGILVCRSETYAIAELMADTYDNLRLMHSEPPDEIEEAIAGPKAEMLITLDGETVMETEVAV